MKIIVTFPYNGELIAPFHIKYLYDLVDEFIIIEARYTHSGVKKPYLFFEKNISLFERYKDKINYMTIDQFPTKPDNWSYQDYMKDNTHDSWFREIYQRDFVKSFLPDSEYILICSDVDEIANREVVKELPKYYSNLDEPVFLEMLFFYYNFNWKKRMNWYHSFVCNHNAVKKYDMSEMRTILPKKRYIRNGGWHCSYFMSYNHLLRKLESFAHRECDKEEIKNQEYISECFKEGKDLFNRQEGESMDKFEDRFQLPYFHEEVNILLYHLQSDEMP